jgi:5-methylcytosine-specific restriction endonuclease McrA
MDTLLLNKDASPISILPLSAVGWQEAIKYIWLDRVHVLEWYDDWVVRSPSWETRVPAVMMVKDYVKAKKYPRFSKYNVTLRDHFECQYCGTSVTSGTVTMDHVMPISLGGKTSWENIVAACPPCNLKKGSSLIRPRREPYKPSYYELANIRKSLPFDIRHPSWKDYLA